MHDCVVGVMERVLCVVISDMLHADTSTLPQLEAAIEGFNDAVFQFNYAPHDICSKFVGWNTVFGDF